MFGLIASNLALNLVMVIEQHRIRNEWIASLPESEQEKIRAEDEQRRREELAHKRALEIAEAGRARNFWGQ